MNVIRFECRRYVVPSLIWAICLSVFGYICIQLFVTFTGDMKSFEMMLNAYSPAMLKAFGAQLTTIKTLPGFYSFCFMYIVAAAAFQATYLGMHVMGKEISGKSADFLFTKPMKRSRIITYKLVSVCICLLLVNVIYTITTLCSAYMTGLPFDVMMLFIVNSSMLLTQLLFLSFGFLLGCVIRRIKTPIMFTTGILCIFFLLAMLVNLEPDGMLSYISFLSYVCADSIIAHNGFELSKLILLCGFSICFLTSGYLLFQRRDIHTI